MHILRFDATLVSTEPDDETRRFIISFYCGDDTIQIYEICDKNSGRIGGRFMERKKQTNPVTGRYYTEKEFVLGATVFLVGFKFMLTKADEYTEKYMEDNSHVFPEASADVIIDKVKKGAAKFPSMQEYAIHLMKTLDKDNAGFVDIADFSAGLKTLNIFCSKQEEHSLLRRFDAHGDGKVSIEEFYNALAASF